MANYKKDSPMFDGTNYSLWNTQMECHLRCIGEPYQSITSNRYVIPPNSIYAEYNIRAKEVLLSAFTDTEMTNVMELKTAYEIQKKLETLYEGDANVKIAKLQSLKGKYEKLRMGDDENVTTFMQRVNELVCGIRCVGGQIDESEIFAKVLRYFPNSYKVKASAIEEL